jgi:hypothetical protein
VSRDEQARESAVQGGRCFIFSRCYVAMQNADALLLLRGEPCIMNGSGAYCYGGVMLYYSRIGVINFSKGVPFRSKWAFQYNCNVNDVTN